MKLKLKINKVTMWVVLLEIGIILNLIFNALYCVGVGNIVTYNVALWIILALGSLVLHNRYPLKNKIKVIFFVALFGLVGNLYGACFVKDGLSSIDNLLINYIAVFVFLGFDGFKLERDAIKSIMSVIVMCGVVTVLYTMFNQAPFFFYVLRGLDVYYNSWLLTSFLGQRNIYAGYCYLSTIASLYLFTNTENKLFRLLYGMIVALLGIQIYATYSRAALIAYLTLMVLFIYYSGNRSKKLIFISCLISALLVLSQTQFVNKIIGTVFTHTTSLGVDSGSIRLSMWSGLIDYLFSNLGFLWGYGIYPTSTLISSMFDYASAHNAFIDSMMFGGIIGLSFLLCVLFLSYKCIKKCADKNYKNIMLAAFISFIIYSTFEAGMLLFSQNYFSVTSTIMFVILPMVYCKNVNSKNHV